MKNGSRRGLFHPDDIPRIARPTASELALDLTPTKGRPLSGQYSRPDPSPITPPPQSAPNLGQHRSVSQSHPSGSLGRAEMRKQTQSELERYTEDEDEDYEDVFGKPGSNGMPFKL
jgi:hypothetical protein